MSYVDHDFNVDEVHCVLSNSFDDGSSTPSDWLPGVVKCSVASLYPFPSLYSRMRRKEITEFTGRLRKSYQPTAMSEGGVTLCLQCSDECSEEPNTSSPFSSSSSPLETLHTQTHAHLQSFIKTYASNPHPQMTVHYAAGCLLSDGKVLTVVQKPLFEYGCTTDPIGGLAGLVDNYFFVTSSCADSELKIVAFLMTDQHKVLHPPFAVGRAFLIEYGYGDCDYYLHAFKEGEGGGVLEVRKVKVGELCNSVPVLSS